MPTRFTEVHISSPVSSMCLRAKVHLEGTKVAVSPRYCAENKVQTGSAAAGGHRRVATRETTGDLATRRGAGDPVRRAEWMTVSRYGHLQSAPVVVGVGYTQGVGTAYTPCSPVVLHAPFQGASFVALCLSSDAQTSVRCPRARVVANVKVWDSERSDRRLLTGPRAVQTTASPCRVPKCA